MSINPEEMSSAQKVKKAKSSDKQAKLETAKKRKIFEASEGNFDY